MLSPTRALRFIRRLEALPNAEIRATWDTLLAEARAILRVRSLLMVHLVGDQLAIERSVGELPGGRQMDQLAAHLGRAVDAPEPDTVGARATTTRFPLAGGNLVLAATSATSDVLFIALFGRPVSEETDWQQDFLQYLAGCRFDDRHADDTVETPLDRATPPRAAAAPAEQNAALAYPAGTIVGSAPAMQAFLDQLRVAVRSDLDVLISGETGTGKEIFAQTLHNSSHQATSQFVPINCAAIPAELLEAELFGVGTRVATGVDARPGLLVRAHGGSLFLDEVGELPLALQAKLLRVLQDRKVTPLGGAHPRQVELRLISATNRDLGELVDQGRFRADLYYRLCGLTLHVPALRKRREDIPQLCFEFSRRAAKKYGKQIIGLSRHALELLVDDAWPGNVRELEQTIERAILHCPDGSMLTASHLSMTEPDRSATAFDADDTAPTLPPAPAPAPLLADGRTLPELVAELERGAILEALDESGGNKSRAAQRLGITRNGLALKIQRLDIEWPR